MLHLFLTHPVPSGHPNYLHILAVVNGYRSGCFFDMFSLFPLEVDPEVGYLDHVASLVTKPFVVQS